MFELLMLAGLLWAACCHLPLPARQARRPRPEEKPRPARKTRGAAPARSSRSRAGAGRSAASDAVPPLRRNAVSA